MPTLSRRLDSRETQFRAGRETAKAFGCLRNQGVLFILACLGPRHDNGIHRAARD